MIQIQNNFSESFHIMPSTKIAQMDCSAKQKGRQSSRQEMSLNDISSWTTRPKSTTQEAENASSRLETTQTVEMCLYSANTSY